MNSPNCADDNRTVGPPLDFNLNELPVRTLIVGAVAAMLLEFVVAVPTVYGVSTWKYVLGAIGLVLFILGGRKPSPKI